MTSGTADSGAGGMGGAAPRLRRRWLPDMVAWLHADLSRPAMDQRILHRLSALTDRELRDIGFVRRDIHDAGLPDTGDVAAFLINRRDARRALRRRLSGGTSR